MPALTKRKLAVGLALFLLGAAYLIYSKEGLSLGGIVTSETLIKWDKPTTDAQWAEDIKAENFDIRSTGVLETMIESHTSKLAKEEQAFIKFQECPECILYEKKETLRSSYPDMTPAELDAEAQNSADTDIKQRQWEIEKIKQSLERMNKEIELRANNKVIRQIHD